MPCRKLGILTHSTFGASPVQKRGSPKPLIKAPNAQGKMPLLWLSDGQALPESEVIVQYLLDKYADLGPSLLPDTPGKRPALPPCPGPASASSAPPRRNIGSPQFGGLS